MDPQQIKLSSIVKTVQILQEKIIEISNDSNIKINLTTNINDFEQSKDPINDVISIAVNPNCLKLNYSASLYSKVNVFTANEGIGAAFLVNNPLGHDVQISISGLEKVFYCHKKFLTKQSKYFEAMLNKDYAESLQESVTIALLYPDTFETALYFFYTGLLKTENITADNYFHFCWLADYLICDDLKMALIPEFIWGYHSSNSFRVCMFPVDMLEGWMKSVMSRQTHTTDEQTRTRERKQGEMSLKWKRKWLQLCLIWADNSKSLLAVKQAVQIIKKYSLVDEKVIPHLSVFIGRCNPEMQSMLDPLGVFEHTNGMQWKCNMWK